MKRLLIAILMLPLSGCVMMTSKTYNREKELWQNVGRLSGYLEAQQQLIAQIAASKPAATPSSIDIDKQTKETQK